MGVRPSCQRGEILKPAFKWIGKAVLEPCHLGKQQQLSPGSLMIHSA